MEGKNKLTIVRFTDEAVEAAVDHFMEMHDLDNDIVEVDENLAMKFFLVMEMLEMSLCLWNEAYEDELIKYRNEFIERYSDGKFESPKDTLIAYAKAAAVLVAVIMPAVDQALSTILQGKVDPAFGIVERELNAEAPKSSLAIFRAETRQRHTAGKLSSREHKALLIAYAWRIYGLPSHRIGESAAA